MAKSTRSAPVSPISRLREELDLLRERGTDVTPQLVKDTANAMGIPSISEQLAIELAKPPPDPPEVLAGSSSGNRDR
jgi:hypothetical protein